MKYRRLQNKFGYLYSHQVHIKRNEVYTTDDNDSVGLKGSLGINVTMQTFEGGLSLECWKRHNYENLLGNGLSLNASSHKTITSPSNTYPTTPST